jgi:poly-gamma-glutamate synthesis protein (capsule biosynthesis protein)
LIFQSKKNAQKRVKLAIINILRISLSGIILLLNVSLKLFIKIRDIAVNNIYKIKKMISSKVRNILLILIILTNYVLVSSQSVAPAAEKISLLFIGDIMGHDEQIWSAENRETHTFDYEDVFKYIKPVVSETDIAIANFEVTLAGPPYMGYPQFSSPAALAVACKNAGIDYMVTANNHAADRGKKGIEGTIHRLDSLSIPHTGTFINSSSRDSLYPLMFKKNGFSFALLNYTYGTNGIAVPEPVLVNILDKSVITADIKKAKSKNPDITILFLHWGNEYDTVPSKAQTGLAEYFFSLGVDLIIGSHPHVLQKMIWLKKPSGAKDGIVVYSMGNFISNQRKPKTDGGAIVRIEFTRKGSDLKISDAGYYLTWVYTPIEKYRKKFFILPCSRFENNPDFFSKPEEYNQMKNFLMDARSLLYKQNLNIGEKIFNGTEWM